MKKLIHSFIFIGLMCTPVMAMQSGAGALSRDDQQLLTALISEGFQVTDIQTLRGYGLDMSAVAASLRAGREANRQNSQPNFSVISKKAFAKLLAIEVAVLWALKENVDSTDKKNEKDMIPLKDVITQLAKNGVLKHVPEFLVALASRFASNSESAQTQLAVKMMGTAGEVFTGSWLDENQTFVADFIDMLGLQDMRVNRNDVENILQESLTAWQTACTNVATSTTTTSTSTTSTSDTSDYLRQDDGEELNADQIVNLRAAYDAWQRATDEYVSGVTMAQHYALQLNLTSTTTNEFIQRTLQHYGIIKS